MDSYQPEHQRLHRETKYRVEPTNTPLLEGLLRSYTSIHDIFPVSTVNSIYFDTKNLDAYFEKLNGDYSKTRFRLRWYDLSDNESDNPAVFAQSKGRLGNKRDKKSTKIDADKHTLVKFPLDGEELRSLGSHFFEVESKAKPTLFPTVRIQYFRQRFIDPISESEICLDTAITIKDVNSQIGQLMLKHQLEFDILEIKYQEYNNPTHIDKLIRDVANLVSISKYAECMNTVLN